MAINAFFCVMVHGQTVPTEQPQRVQHPYYQYDGFIEAKKGILLPRRIANFTPKSPVLIYDTVSGKVSVYFGGWKSFQNVAYTSDYNDLINRPDLTQYVPTSRTINGYSLTSNITINKVDIGLGNVQNVDVTNAGNITSGTLSDARLSANVTLQGNTFNGANQLLQLDAGGKVAYANLPASLMIYKGVWDASTNTPTLADGSGVNGWVYRVHPGGTVNFGSGNITFLSGDYVIYNGSVWQKSAGGDAVTSVNGQQGVVVLTTANIAEGGTNYYYTNTRVQTFGDTRYSLLNHEHVYSDIANLSSYTGFDVRYKSISYVPAWSEITGKPSFATVATSGSYTDLSGTPTLGSLSALSSIGNTYITDVAWSKVTGAPSFLTTESDPIFTASSWYSTTNNASNWNTAYSWGNYANRTLTINGTTYDLSANRSWTVGDVRTDGSYSNPSWINSIAWAKLTGIPSSFTPSAHTHPYSDLTGTVPTWNQNTTGNAATATNATQWNGVQYESANYSTGSVSGFMIYNLSLGKFQYATTGYVQSFLGLGSNAYTSTAFLPLTGGTLTGALSGTSGSFTTSSSGLAGFFRNTDATNGYGVAIESEGTSSTRYALTVRNLSGSYTFFHVSTETGKVGNIGIGTNSPSVPLDVRSNSGILVGAVSRSIIRQSVGGDAEIGAAAGGYLSLLTNGGIGANLFDGGTFEAVAMGRFKGWYTAGSGLALEVGVSSGAGNMIAYNRTSNAYADINIGGVNLNLVQQGGAITVNGLFRPNTNYAADLGSSSFRFSSIYAYDANLVSAITASTFIRSGGTSSQALIADGSVLSIAAANTAGALVQRDGNGDFNARTISLSGALSVGGITTSNSFIKSGGTSSQFLKADGSVDANTYITSAVTSIAGTSNQIAVSAATGSVTVSLTNNVVIPGTITSSASYESSDRRLKRALSGTRLIGQIESLQARLYEKDGRDEYGYYAQDALKIIPTAVKQRADGYYDLSYTQVFVVKIASLEKRVSELETLLKKIYGK